MCHRQQQSKVSSPSNLTLKSYGPDTDFGVWVHCDLDLRDMTSGQGHDTPLSKGQQLCEILSWSNMAVRSYGLGMDLEYLCAVTLTFEVWPWPGQGHYTPLNQGQQLCEILSRSDKWLPSYGPDTMWTDGQTDGQTGWFLYTPPQTLFAGGIIMWQTHGSIYDASKLSEV